jgi:hypothetical protein
MPKPPPLPETVEPTEIGPTEESFYEVPPELGEPTREPERSGSEGGHGEPPLPGRSRSTALKIAIGTAVVLALGAALLGYRSHHRRKVLQAGLVRAEQLIRLDTAAGYREAAALLEPLAQMDPLEAASARAFALAMLFADYRDADAEAQANALLVEPGRAAAIPRHAHLANAALALGRNVLGDATTAASSAQGSLWADALQARIALRAGTLAAAIEPAAAAASDGAFAAGLAIEGDVARRGRNEVAAARASYAAALAASPTNARAAFGLAKLALAGQMPPQDAVAALQRLVDDRTGTLAPERARAALHLAALRLRAEDRAGAVAALDGAGLDAPARAWAERAAASAAGNRTRYEVVGGAPAALQSPSDDDPWIPPPPPPRPDHVGVDPLDARPPPPPRASPKPPARLEHAVKKAPAKKPVTAKKAVATKKLAAKKAAAKAGGGKATAKAGTHGKKKPAPKRPASATADR